MDSNDDERHDYSNTIAGEDVRSMRAMTILLVALIGLAFFAASGAIRAEPICSETCLLFLKPPGLLLDCQKIEFFAHLSFSDLIQQFFKAIIADAFQSS